MQLGQLILEHPLQHDPGVAAVAPQPADVGRAREGDGGQADEDRGDLDRVDQEADEHLMGGRGGRGR
jgi:hypothetical protein